MNTTLYNLATRTGLCRDRPQLPNSVPISRYQVKTTSSRRILDSPLKPLGALTLRAVRLDFRGSDNVN